MTNRDAARKRKGVVLLDSTSTKSKRRREVPLNGRADAVLARRGSKDAGLVFGTRRWDHFCTAWESAVERAKLVDFHFHDLRHTFASWAVQRGATLQEVKKSARSSFTGDDPALRAPRARAPPHRRRPPRRGPARAHRNSGARTGARALQRPSGVS